MKYIKELDGLRAFAVLIVILTHATNWMECGWIGVQVFFVLSGFLITSILLHDKEGRTFGEYIKRFYWRRSLRIFPVYFAYLIGIGAVLYLTSQGWFFKEKLTWLVTYSFNFYKAFWETKGSPFFTPLWSLAVEEQFYLVWPFLIYFLPKRSLKALIVGVVLTVPILRYWLGHMLIDHGFSNNKTSLIIYFLTPTQIDSFMFGAMIPAFGLQEAVKNKAIWLAGAVNLFVYAGLINLLNAGHSEGITLGYIPMNLGGLQHVWSYSVIAMSSMFAVLFLLERKVALFGNSLAVSIGKVSYGIYLFHWPVLVFLNQATGLNFGSLKLLPIYLACVYGLSLLSFKFFEEKFTRLKDKSLSELFSWNRTAVPTA